jgi:uncharacterized protein YciI
MSAEIKMFAVLVKYLKPLEQVDAVLAPHRAYLQAHCDAGRFIMAGPQVPRTGGLILARAGSKEELRKLLEDDPFHRAGVAEYDIIEIVPAVYSTGFAEFTK